MLIPGGSAAKLHEFIKKNKKTKWMFRLRSSTPWNEIKQQLHSAEIISEVRGELANIWRGGAFRCEDFPLCPGCCGHRCISVCRCSCSEPLPSPAFLHPCWMFCFIIPSLFTIPHISYDRRLCCWNSQSIPPTYKLISRFPAKLPPLYTYRLTW